jgi:tryptophan 2,3-dioxygenase
MNYWEYIHVEELLRLQGGIEDDEDSKSNDEVLFIVVHQIYELWFKLILRELTSARDLFHQNPVPDMALANAVRSLKRVVTIMEQAVQHFKVMETLTTRDYLEFRDKLIPASGFQSAQLREIEILLGLEDSARIPLGREGSYKEALRKADGSPSPATERLERRLAGGPSLREVLYDWLERTPVDGAEGSPDRFLRDLLASHRRQVSDRVEIARNRSRMSDADVASLRERYDQEMDFAERFLLGQDDPATPPDLTERKKRVRAALVFIESYRELPRLAWPREVVDTVIELEQAFIVWRQRHARMVERVIGRRIGTGGSSGVDYLDQTALRYRVFADLWAVRTVLLQKPNVPPIQNEGEFRFRVEDREGT